MIAEILKKFDEKFVGPEICLQNCHPEDRKEIKQFLIQEITALLEGLKLDKKTFPELESDAYDDGYANACDDLEERINKILK